MSAATAAAPATGTAIPRPPAISQELRNRVTDFLVEYAWLVDNDHLEQWVELFAPEGRYEIIPRENVVRGMPLALLSCRNKAMVGDRVLALRVANEYNEHVDRHVISPPRVVEVTDGTVRFEANFIVAQTDQRGNSKLFAAGTYQTLLAFDADSMLIREHLVILDTFCVPTLIATPL